MSDEKRNELVHGGFRPQAVHKMVAEPGETHGLKPTGTTRPATKPVPPSGSGAASAPAKD